MADQLDPTRTALLVMITRSASCIGYPTRKHWRAWWRPIDAALHAPD